MTSDERASLLGAYQAISSRRLGYDQMAWQTPTLGFTAQAFLFTIALGVGVSGTSRVVAATLSLIVALLSIQLLQKHHHMELIDSTILARIDETLEIPRLLSTEPDNVPVRPNRDAAARREALGMTSSALVKLHSPTLWTWGMSAFAAASVLIIALTVFAPSTLP